MKFTANSKLLLAALTTCSKAIGNNIVIANNCYRLALDKQLSITACNNQVSISTKIDAKGDKCDFLLPSDLKKWIATINDQDLDFEIEPQDKDFNIKIRSVSGDCSFIGYNSEDFPTINTDAGNTTVLDFSDISKALNRTVYSILTDNTANVLNHLSLELSETGAQMVGYNGVIFAIFKFGGVFTETNLMLPEKLLSALQGLPNKGECQLVYSDKNICFTVDGIEVKSILVDGKYIEYKHGLIIPPDNAACNRVEFINAIKRVLMFSNKTSNLVKIQFSSLGIQVFGSDDDLQNKAHELVAASCNADLIVGFNGEMAIDALNHLESENITISYSTPKQWVVFHQSLEEKSYSMIAPMVITV